MPTKRLSHDNRIEIRRKHLLLHALGRGFAHESAFAVMHTFDDAFIVAIGRRHVLTISPVVARTSAPFTKAVACSQRSSRPSFKRTSG